MVVHRLLVVVASLTAEHTLQGALVVAVLRLQQWVSRQVDNAWTTGASLHLQRPGHRTTVRCDPMDLQHSRLHQLWNLLKLMSIESVMPSSHLILWRPLLLLS